ncbi:hypothetical protein CFOL_v3_30938, partial [Cephalotus follicularis]
DQYGVSPRPKKLYRARQKAQNQIEGKNSEAYSKVLKYVKLLRETNPDTTMRFEHHPRLSTSEALVFMRMFICYRASKKGFLGGCRRFIGSDGCHLMGIFRGVMLSTVSIDGNKGLFPAAFVVVESEYIGSWKFFME